MPLKNLEKLYRHFVKESQALVWGFNTPDNLETCRQPHKFGREMCIVQLHDAWARACKELMIASACDKPLTSSGRIVPLAPHIISRRDILPVLRGTYTGRSRKHPNWEPRWGDTTEFLNVARRLNLHNYSTLSLGMSVTPNPTDHLRMVRNFFAHRGAQTANLNKRIARVYAIPAKSTPEELVNFLIAPGLTIFESWVNRLRTMLRVAVG